MRILVAAPMMPEFDRESGSRRLFNLIELLRTQGHQITFLCQHDGADARYARILRQQGILVFTGSQAPVSEIVAGGCFDLALCAFWYVAEALLPTIRTMAPSCRVVVDSIDLHFLRGARSRFHEAPGNSAAALDDKYAQEMIRELNTYAAADGVFTVSEKEAEIVRDFTSNRTPTWCVPDYEELPPSAVTFLDRRGILFIGNFRHAPNISAVEFLCKEVVPRICTDVLEEHPVQIVGNAPTEAVFEMARLSPYVRVVGWVPSVLPYLHRARVATIPLLYGAGTKRKLIQSLMVGTPTVSTLIGIEGLPLVDGHHLLIADKPQAFASAIERLIVNESVWNDLSARGSTIMRERQGRETASRQLFEAIDWVMASAQSPRLLRSVSREKELYAELLGRIRECVEKAIPKNATVLVISKGDPELLDLHGRRAWHFPRAADGSYAGYYPKHGVQAIEWLEQSRRAGADYLLVPETSSWWLDHYCEFREHLYSHYCIHFQQQGVCDIFELRALSDAHGTDGQGAARQATLSETVAV
jgi:glycosyltransferase involved in cell wall biosynthesis